MIRALLRRVLPDALCPFLDAREIILVKNDADTLTGFSFSVDCSTSTWEGCRVRRRVKAIRAALRTETLGGIVSRASTAAFTDRDLRDVSGVLFLDVPPQIHRAELAEFVQRCAYPHRSDFSFVNTRDQVRIRTASASEANTMTLFPQQKIVFANPPIERTFAARLIGESGVRTGVVELIYLKSAGGSGAGSPMTGRKEMDVAGSEEVGPKEMGVSIVAASTPIVPKNVYEVLGAAEETISDVQTLVESVVAKDSSSSSLTPPETKLKREGKKSKSTQDQEVDKLVDAILAPAPARPPTSPGTTASAGVSVPQPTNSGNLPESHSPDLCAVKQRAASQTQHKTQATWAIEREKRSPGSTSKAGVSLEKDREEAKMRLKTKLGELEKGRSGGKRKGK
ncbi:hypothetical protein HDU93_008124 [Gonapodya sp. JEL0774]|nr:hypothetical protein HDU93_008124 [Gonapodya sp. JEL0774]